MESVNIRELNERIQKESSFVDLLTLEMGKVIVGQKHLVDNLLIGLLITLFKLYCTSAVALLHLDVDLVKHVFSLLGEVALENPVEVLWRFGQHFFHALALVLTEVEDYHIVIVTDNASCKIDISVLA